MLHLLNTLQLLLYIGALALMGQGALYLIAGPQRKTNAVYRLFELINRPWTGLAARLTPRRLSVRQHPIVAFCVVAVGYLAVTLAKIDFCLRAGMAVCRS